MATLRKNLESSTRPSPTAGRRCGRSPRASVAQESLFEAFRRKVALLQDTIALMNEMRKGNRTGPRASSKA